jgi:ArsR family transcriptional regulator
MDRGLKQTARCLKAISDPSRLKILKLLQMRTSCVCELTAVLGFAQPTISRHLRVLEDAGFVHSRRRGLRMDYVLAGEDAPPIVKQLMGLIREWHESDPAIVALRERLKVVASRLLEGPLGKARGQAMSASISSKNCAG